MVGMKNPLCNRGFIPTKKPYLKKTIPKNLLKGRKKGIIYGEQNV